MQAELGALTRAWGVEITKVELSEVKLIQEGENMALATFNKAGYVLAPLFSQICSFATLVWILEIFCIFK